MVDIIELADGRKFEATYEGVTQEVAAAIREVYVATDGARGIEMAHGILTAATDESSPLHSYFTWDDTAAAKKWRLEQAARLAARVHVRYIPPEGGPSVAARAYLSARDILPDDVDDETARRAVGQFIGIEEFVGKPAHEALLLASIKRDITRLKKKYKSIKDFNHIVRDLLDGMDEDNAA